MISDMDPYTNIAMNFIKGSAGLKKIYAQILRATEKNQFHIFTYIHNLFIWEMNEYRS